MTNGDMLRSMTDKELANIVELIDCKIGQVKCPYLCDHRACTEHDCRDGFLEWLSQEVNDNMNVFGKDINVRTEIGHWIEIEHYSNHGDEYCDCICSKCHHRISRPRGMYPNFCEDCGSQMLCLVNTRDLTDEESAVYDKWLNYKAKKTGDTLW